jgi:hypothetical protein
MAQQQTLFDTGAVNLRQFEPVKAAIEGAARFTGGRHSIAGLENVQADRPRAFRIQKAYREAQGAPEPADTRGSYAAMSHEVGKQYQFMTKPREEGGMGFTHETVGHDPYASPREMAQDVSRGHIKTMSTEATGGHAFFSNEANDQFRAVHDVFGHAATGRGFDRHGEEAAFLSHKQMFSKRAMPAVASETRGQNSMLNYGPNPGHFPEQSEKLVRMPGFASGVRKKVRKRMG